MTSRFWTAAWTMIAATLAMDAQAIAINEQRFEALGGTLGDPSGSMAVVAARLQTESRQPQFLGVGELTFAEADHRCTGTWLGEDASHAYVMTAAHCVAENFRTAPWVRRAGRVALLSDDLRVRGNGTAFIAPVAVTPGSGLTERERSDSDVAIIRLPKGAKGASMPVPPLLDDIDGGGADVSAAGWTTTYFVGYGTWHVGTQSLDTDGRLWASSLGSVTGLARQRFIVGYQATGATERWFSGTSGDSGGAFWQPVAGYWRVVGVASARDARWAGSEGPRLAAVVHWLKGIFPGARTLSDRLSVTSTTPFVSRNHAEDVSRGPVVYRLPPQADATAPASMRAPDGSGYSVIEARAEEALTRRRVAVRLRAQRETGCGWMSTMDDDTTCGPTRSGRLTVSFHPEDNPALERGSYLGQIDLEAVGSQEPAYRQRFPLQVRIGHELEGTLTATQAYQAPDLKASLSLRDDAPVDFLLPPQAGARREEGADGDRGFSRVLVTVRDVLEDTDRTLVLRAYRPTGTEDCPTATLGATVDCREHPLSGGLTLRFAKEDNAGLPRGIYCGHVFLQARGGESARHEQIAVEIRIQTI